MTNIAEIYVALVDEGVDVWKPIQAERLSDNVYRIIDQPYDRTIEKWQFEPGDMVVCGMIESSDGRILAATKKASED